MCEKIQNSRLYIVLSQHKLIVILFSYQYNWFFSFLHINEEYIDIYLSDFLDVKYNEPIDEF